MFLISSFSARSRNASIFLDNVISFTIVIKIVGLLSKLLRRHRKANCIAPAYSLTLRRVRGVVQRVFQGRSRSCFQIVRGGSVCLNLLQWELFRSRIGSESS